MKFDIESLKRSRETDIAKIADAFTKQAGTYDEDKDFWRLEADKAGNGSATIRFVPFAEMVDGQIVRTPFVVTYEFLFQGPTGRWYRNNCLKTIGQEDPALQHVNDLWATKDPDNIALARTRRLRTNYIANILVINDPKHPENEGKVFKFKFGKAIKNMLDAKIKPAFEDEVGLNPFDEWEGCNFKFRMRRQGDNATYVDSTFTEKCAIGDDSYIVDVLSRTHNIKEYLDPSRFKTYDKLKEDLDRVLGTSKIASKVVSAAEIMEDVPSFSSPMASAPSIAQSSIQDDDDDDMMAEFKKMIAGD